MFLRLCTKGMTIDGGRVCKHGVGAPEWSQPKPKIEPADLPGLLVRLTFTHQCDRRLVEKVVVQRVGRLHYLVRILGNCTGPTLFSISP